MKDQIVKILLSCGMSLGDVENENYIANELLESLQIAEIVMGIEDEFEIEIDGDDIIPENFENINMIEKMVMRYIKDSNAL